MAEQKKRGRSREIALELLKILEEETDRNNLLSKRKLVELHAERYRDDDENDLQDKTFYLKIDEIEAAGFPIKHTKGKATRYYLDEDRLTGEELLFLACMIKSSPDLGEEEAEVLSNKLLRMRAHKKAKEYVKQHSSIVKEQHNPVSKQIHYLALLLEAKQRAGKVSCKLVLSREGGYKFSERCFIRPRQINFTRGGVLVSFDLNGVTKYDVPLRDIIDIEPE